MKTIACYHIKGGVGKTSTAVNLAALAARDGQRTLLWDLDPQAAATYLFRIRPRVKGGGRALVQGTRPMTDAIKGTDFEGLDLLPADFTYRNLDLTLDAGKRPTQRLGKLLTGLAEEYDTVVLDCPPSASLVSESILNAADLVAVPLVPTPLSLRTFDQLTDFIAGLPLPHPPVLAFFSMVDRRKSLHRQIVADLPTQRSGICQVSIPDTTVVEQMAVHRAPVVEYAPRSPIARRYQALWREVQAAYSQSLRLKTR